jgi:hypothetical protein
MASLVERLNLVAMTKAIALETIEMDKKISPNGFQ